MKEKMKSDTTGREYCPSDAIRIVNNKQALFYMQNGCILYDIYPSEDFKTGQPIMVYVFNKLQTSAYYEQWKENRP